MNKLHQAFLFSIVIGFLGLLGCASNRGVEAGNPDLKGKTTTIELETSATVYIFKVLEMSTIVSQVNPDSFETVSVGFDLEGGLLSFEAAFSDGTQTDIQSQFDQDANLVELQVRLNGQLTPAQARAQTEALPAAEPGQAFLEVAAALCERIVSCNRSFTQEACEPQVLAVPNLSHDFGDNLSQTLNEAQARLDSGELDVDGEALLECASGIGIVP